MKKIKVITNAKEFEDFVNNDQHDIISIDIKSVEQSFYAQDCFIAVIYYRLIENPF